MKPELLTVKKETLITSQIDLKEDPHRILQLSDVHLELGYEPSDLVRLVERINNLSPDLIIFTGDLIEDNKTFSEVDATITALSKLSATYGKYAVYGNHDHGSNGTRRYATIMKESGFELLVNEHATITLKNGEKINLIGIDDIVLSKIDIPGAMAGIRKDAYNIFISHAPDVVDRIFEYPIDLQLSGHSHGGQVRIPFIGAPFTPPYGEQYVKGRYTFDTERNLTLYVNVGVGTSQLRYRFFNIPEITLFLLKNE